MLNAYAILLAMRGFVAYNVIFAVRRERENESRERVRGGGRERR